MIKKGFSLAEMMVVLLIMSIMMAAAAPIITKKASQQPVTAVGDMPVGIISPYGGTNNPPGWLICDGTSYPVSKYKALYKAIGNNYGGDSSNFNVPNLIGRSPIGAGNFSDNRGNVTYKMSDNLNPNNEGERLHLLTVDELAKHNHGMTNSTTSSSVYYNLTSKFSVYTDPLVSTTRMTTGRWLCVYRMNDNHTVSWNFDYPGYSSCPAANLVYTVNITDKSVYSVPNSPDVTYIYEKQLLSSSFTNITPDPNILKSSYGVVPAGTSTDASASSSTSTSAPAGNDVPHNNMQPYTVTNYIIKY